MAGSRVERGASTGAVVLVILLVIGVGVGGFAMGHSRAGSSGTSTRSVATEPAPTTTTTTTASPHRAFDVLFDEAKTGVVRVEASQCGEAGGLGSGFLIDPTHVVTVAHVVENAVTIVVRTADGVRRGTVVGVDRGAEVALVQLDSALDGHVFSFATSPARVGASVAFLGFPKGLPLTLTKGTVSGRDRKIILGSGTVSGLVQTDAPINPGNSGGPLIDDTGAVVGLGEASAIDAAGIGYAVDAETASKLVTSLRGASVPPPPATCDDPHGPAGEGDVTSSLTGADAGAIKTALDLYFNAIDTGDYTTAWQQLSPKMQAGLTVAQLESSTKSSDDFDVQLVAITPQPDGSTVAYVTFRSLQSSEKGPRPGETCTDWSIDYTMVQTARRWVIDRAAGHAGQPVSAPCPTK